VFPSIETISVDVRGWPDGLEKEYGIFDAATLPPQFDCWNTRCRGGKFDIDALIREMLPERRTAQKFSLVCAALEFGRNARPCATRCEISIAIRYKGVPNFE
jgi:hypothetical protein